MGAELCFPSACGSVLLQWVRTPGLRIVRCRWKDVKLDVADLDMTGPDVRRFSFDLPIRSLPKAPYLKVR